MVICPKCGNEIKKKIIKEWSYGSISVKRYECTCSQKFNHYDNGKGKEWTLPKKKA